MIRDHRVRWALIVASLFASAWVQAIVYHMDLTIAKILGGAFPLLLIPFLIALIFKWVVQSFEKKVTDTIFLIIFLIAWVFMIVAHIIANKTDTISFN